MKNDTTRTALPDKQSLMLHTITNLQKEIETLQNQNNTLQEELKHYRESGKTVEAAGPTSQELQLAELIIDNSPAVLFRRLAAKDPKLRKMVYVSPNISRFGYSPEDFLSGKIMFRDILFPGDNERTLKEIQHYMENNIETYSQIYRIVTRKGEVRWIEDRTSVVEDTATGIRYHQGIVIDIHRRKVAEEKLRKSEEKFRRIVETAGEGFLLMDKDMKIIDLNSAFIKLVGFARSELIGTTPFTTEIEPYQQLSANCKEQSKESEYCKFECSIARKDRQNVPVLVHAGTLRSDTEEVIGNMAFITDMTTQKKALSLAGEVQQSLLPDTPPRLTGLEVAGTNIPCEEVGGDYYDYLFDTKRRDGKLTVIVGDIAGHGIDSALLMSSARAFLRMRASQPGTTTEIISAMNRHLTEDVYDSGRFMTLFFLTIDQQRKNLEWIRAGHDPALLYSPDRDNFEELKGPGLALGVDPDYTFQVQKKTDLKPGQIVVIATDGIWEGCNKHGEMLG